MVSMVDLLAFEADSSSPRPADHDSTIDPVMIDSVVANGVVANGKDRTRLCRSRPAFMFPRPLPGGG